MQNATRGDHPRVVHRATMCRMRDFEVKNAPQAANKSMKTTPVGFGRFGLGSERKWCATELGT